MKVPKVIDHEEMRWQILTKSHRVFCELGYQSVSMRRLAERIGVSTGVLYHYFLNKEELVRAVLSMGVEEPVTGYRSDPTFKEMRRDLPIEEKLKILFESMKECDDTAITTIMLMSDYCRDTQSSDDEATKYDLAFKYLKSFKKAMGIDERDSDMARFVLAYLVGVHTIRMWTGNRTSIREFGGMLLKYFKRPTQSDR